MEERRGKRNRRHSTQPLAGLNKQIMPSSYNLGPEDLQKDGLVPPKGTETLTPKEEGVFMVLCKFSFGCTGHGKAINIMGVTQSQLMGNVCRVPRSPPDCSDLESLPAFPGLSSPDPQTQHAVFSRTSRAWKGTSQPRKAIAQSQGAFQASHSQCLSARDLMSL